MTPIIRGQGTQPVDPLSLLLHLFSPLTLPSASCFVPILDAFISLANFRFCIILGLCKASRRSWSSLSEFPWLHFTSNNFSSKPVAGYLRLTSCLPLYGVEKRRGIPFCGRHQRYHRDRGPLLRPGIVVAAAVQHVGFRLRDSLASREGGRWRS